ncbi:MAG: hypothetical protein ACOZF0_02790 [Thermodesulfobacteriota bacterium]
MMIGHGKSFVSAFTAVSILLLLTGCAGLGKPSAQPVKTMQGKKVMGETVGYLFNLKPMPRSDQRYLLTKRPYCAEEMEELTVSRDPRDEAAGMAATVSAPLALVFPRIGQPLIMSAFEKSRNETVQKTGTIRTGKVASCGSPEPAPGEALFIQSADMKTLLHTTSDTSGILDLAPVIRTSGDAPYLNVFIDNGGSVFFVATVFIR